LKYIYIIICVINMYLILQRTTSSSNPREDFKEKNSKMSSQMNDLVMFFRLI
jgi:hypothetical protein